MTAQDLKNSILQLAVRGKLVEQRFEEGTVKELLAQIKVEKEQLVEESKKEKALLKITEDEIPFEIPKSWEWARLAGVCIYLQRGKSPKYSDIKKIPVIAQKCNQWDSFQLEKAQFIVPETLEKYSEERLLQDKDILINSTGLGTVGRNQIYPACNNPYGIAVADSHVTVVRLDSRILTPEFFFYYWRNPSVQLVIEDQTSGSTKQKELALTTIQNYLVPIPPLAEQKRIVAKIEEILPYVEQYDKAYTELETFNQKFPEDMQKSILQYAMQGKLIEQRPEEGTGEELYCQIQAEKEKLIKEGKIKKEKNLPEITEEEIPFDIPNTWTWVKVGDLFTIIRGSSPRPKGSPLYWSEKKTDYNWITIKDISAFCKNGILSHTTEYLTEAGADLSTYVGKDELIIAVSGSTTGKHCVLGIDGYIYDGLAAILNPTKIINSSYLLLFFDWVYDRLNAQKVGSAFPNINTDILKNTLMPLPPLREQERIVMAMKNFVPYCQRLAK